MKKTYMKPTTLAMELNEDLCLGIGSGEANGNAASAKRLIYDDEDDRRRREQMDIWE